MRSKSFAPVRSGFLADTTNFRLKSYCEQVGFWKEKEVSFPHKQSNLMKIRRDSWEHPAL